MAIFNSLSKAPEDPILGLTQAFKSDSRENKVNLGVGAYRDAEGKSMVLNCVRKAEQILFEKQLGKEYLPICGNPDFIKETVKLVFGSECDHSRIVGVQTIGGTGALRLGGEFLIRNHFSSNLYLSDPSWDNHTPIFQKSGFKVDSFPYYDARHFRLNFTAMLDAIRSMPTGSTILLQACCHNPTGIDPSFEQWEELSALIKQRKIIPYLDLAYQGFDQGLEEDARVVRMFMDQHQEMLVASSFSKNLGLYGERVGHLAIVCADKSTAETVNSQIKQIIRGSYSMPPLHGQRIVTTILQSESLKSEWQEELSNMKLRINEMRRSLLDKLSAKGKQQQFAYLSAQNGIFSLSGLNPEQVQKIRKDFGIYMLANGRINVAGLNNQNIDYFTESLLSINES
jgi:aspartate aminotransferase